MTPKTNEDYVEEVRKIVIRYGAEEKEILEVTDYLRTLLIERDKQKEEAVAVAVKAEKERVTKLLADMVATKRERGGAMGNIISEANVNLTILNILTPPTN